MNPATNGSGKRKLGSWIDRFVEVTASLESPTIFRKWTAISTIASVLEQKVWLETSSTMYPNLYVFLVAPPGGGKSRTIDLSRDLITSLPDPYIAPTSINAASLIDHIKECKRSYVNGERAPIEYNAMSVVVGEFGTFMSSYDDDLMAILTDFYNVRPYGQRRRGQGGLKISIERPSLNLLVGSTPSNLMKFMPENAWGMGFASRIMFVYSEEKSIIDDFASTGLKLPHDLFHDLGVINFLGGQFSATKDYSEAVLNWRNSNEPPRPTHPRLQHYNSRRKEHLYRLSMVAAIDRGNHLILGRDEFNRALGWMVEIEASMPEIFQANTLEADAAVYDEVVHMVMSKGPMKEGQLVNHIAKKVKAGAVKDVLKVLVQSGRLEVIHRDRFGVMTFVAPEVIDILTDPPA